MTKFRSTFVALTLFLLAGAGCLGGDSTTTAASGGIWVSDNQGASWTPKNALPLSSGTGSINGLDVLALEQDPSDDTVLYLGSKTSGLFYTYDQGESWMRPEAQLAASGSVLAIEVDPRNVCTYYLLKADRLLKTTTCGREFDTDTYVETRTDEALTALALDWYNPETLYLGNTEGDVLRSLDGGATWTAVARHRNAVVDILVSNSDSRIVIAGTLSGGVFRSVDGGAVWVSLKDSMSELKNSHKVLGFSQTDDGARVLMHSGYGLAISDDQAASWQGISLVSASGDGISAAEISPQNKELFYYASGATFYTSTSGGDAWSTATLPTTRAASVIHVDESNPERIYLGGVTIDD